jgi:hypothetical protein
MKATMMRLRVRFDAPSVVSPAFGTRPTSSLSPTESREIMNIHQFAQLAAAAEVAVSRGEFEKGYGMISQIAFRLQDVREDIMQKAFEKHGKLAA